MSLKVMVDIDQPGEHPGSVEILILSGDSLHLTEWKVVATIEYDEQTGEAKVK